MNKLFKSILTILLLIFPFIANATKIEIEGIYYNLNGTSAEVTYRGDEEDGWMYFQADELYTGDIVIPDSVLYEGAYYQVTSIGNDAFAGSRQMTSLSLPSSISDMGSGLFSLCTSLSSISVDEDNPIFFSSNGILYKRNPTSLYFAPRNLQGDITLDSTLTTIPSSAFQNCTGITSVTLPDNITEIADGAFTGCTGLTEIFFNSKLTTIGEYAFSKCTSLSIVNLPTIVKNIKSCAFMDCTGLYYVLLHEGLESIGKMAFYNCQNIMGIQLPSTLKSISEQAFQYCYNLSSIKNDSPLSIELGSTDYGYVAYYATEIIDDTDPTSVHYITTPCTDYVNVYSVTGIIVKSHVIETKALDNLSKGIYIVNGKLMQKTN